jgi:RimJ/RimL family protein N-acetyltransferase
MNKNKSPKKNKSKAPLLSDKFIRLREITYQDTDNILFWRNHSVLGKYISFSRDPLTKETHENYLKDYFKDKNSYYYIAEEINSNKAIGTISLDNIDIYAKKAESGKFLIDPNYRLYAFEVVYLLFAFAFETLNLNKIYSLQQKQNPAKDFTIYLGGQIEGVLKEHYWNGEMLDDIIQFAFFKPDFEKLKASYFELKNGFVAK